MAGSTVILLLILSIGSVLTRVIPRKDGGLSVQILHTNDMHARFVQTSKMSSTCSKSDAAAGHCYGGFARVATVVREARNSSTPTLFLNAGDTYQGTVWYNAHKWKIVARFLNILNPDAVSLGNHEFDDGISGLIPFINNVTFPVLAANLNLTLEPELEATKLAKSTILTVNGTQIGVIGYLTPDTKSIASTENVIFLDEVTAVAAEAAKLKAQGVNILIALGHSGYSTDKKIAAEVEDIDLVIGGHTNTFLYTGEQPDSEIPEGYYPTAVTQASGRTVYVVQAYAYTKYVGNFSVEFDADGEVTFIEGNPILLNGSVEQAADVLAELELWKGAVDNLTTTVVGTTRVLLDGDGKTCRSRECNLGNLITDAYVEYATRQYAGTDGWTNAAIAVQHSGGIRTSITRDNDNQITMADVLAVLPFGDSALMVNMTGSSIRSMLEWSVRTLEINSTSDLNGAFLQFSGLQVVYDLGQPAFSRVVSVKVRCASCRIPQYHDLEEGTSYNVLINSFLHQGGDGYTVFSNKKYTDLGINDADLLVEYLQKRSPVYPAVEWRINFQNTVTEDTNENSTGGSVHITSSVFTVGLLILIHRLLT
ncbi:protein 5NUC isoform X2 [Cephus cinctus]|uniref:5'-nucleotidase n=1 Tax=Cephus cinctus TaxID=211228 RepID=A0AAJ7RHH9_CEPCN|nr:protein 5NUC isoform X2 [Cephus cinctus]